MISWLLALLASSQVPYELLALVFITIILQVKKKLLNCIFITPDPIILLHDPRWGRDP